MFALVAGTVHRTVPLLWVRVRSLQRIKAVVNVSFTTAFIGAADRARTGTVLRPRDFKSLVSTNSTTAAYPALLVLWNGGHHFSRLRCPANVLSDGAPSSLADRCTHCTCHYLRRRRQASACPQQHIHIVCCVLHHIIIFLRLRQGGKIFLLPMVQNCAKLRKKSRRRLL